jgi:hypothetical protein
MTDAHTLDTAHADPNSKRSEATELRRLRRLIREQLAGAVIEDRLDIDLANGMLTVCGLPELPRRWTVRIGLTFVCEVTAGTDHDAYDTAEDAIAAAVSDAACPIDIDYDGREQIHATAGDIDTDALTDESAEPTPGPA